jgi:hypothetical protein
LPTQSFNQPTIRAGTKIISELNHPNIFGLHDVGNLGGVDYLVMDCVEGETPPKRLERSPLSIDLVLKYGTFVAEAFLKTRNHFLGADFRVEIDGHLHRV